MDSAVERLRPVLLFGGTTEGRELAARLAGRGQRTILCVATDYGREVLEPELLANPCLDVRIDRGREGPVPVRRENKSLFKAGSQASARIFAVA